MVINEDFRITMLVNSTFWLIKQKAMNFQKDQ